MNIYSYPLKIAYYGGSSYTNSEFEKGFAIAWAGDKSAYRSYSGYASYSSIASNNPNGVELTSQAGDTGKDTRTAFLYSQLRSGYADYEANATYKHTIGRGFDYTLKAKASYGGKGGDLDYFFVYDSVQRSAVTNNGYTNKGRYSQHEWPFEKIETFFSNTYTSESGSYLQLANGYFTGPPTYKTTGSKYGFVIVSKTSLKWTTTNTDITILVTGPHTTQKSKPENFLWVAGGIGMVGASTRPEEICVGYYDMMDNMWYEGLPAYRHYGISLLPSEHSTSNETFAIKGQSFDNKIAETTYSAVNKFPNYTEQAQATRKFIAWQKKSIYYSDPKTIPSSTTYWSINENEEDYWPIIQTVEQTYQKTLYEAGSDYYTYKAGMDKRPVRTMLALENGDEYVSTTNGDYEIREALVEAKDEASTMGINYERGINKNTTYFGYNKDYYLTWPVELGFVHQKHETSKKGYYFTSPQTLFKNATEVGTKFDFDTYRCFDATCIDIKRYARATAFQTGKTYNNSLVLATRKAPRNTSRGVSDTLSLQSIQSFSTYDTVRYTNTDLRNAGPACGIHKYKLNPYGESASYSYSGYTTITEAGTATKLIPNTSNTYYTPMIYDSLDLRVGLNIDVRRYSNPLQRQVL